MRKSQHLHLIRIVQKCKTNRPEDMVYGVTIPPSFKNWFGLFVTMKEKDGALILESGAQPISFTNKEVKRFSSKIETVNI